MIADVSEEVVLAVGKRAVAAESWTYPEAAAVNVREDISSCAALGPAIVAAAAAAVAAVPWMLGAFAVDHSVGEENQSKVFAAQQSADEENQLYVAAPAAFATSMLSRLRGP